MKKTIGILAHVDAGKTTLAEGLLHLAGATRRRGGVEEGTSLLDCDAIERARGITVFSGQAHFSFGGDEYALIDTPGHADFAAEMERALSVLDGAVLLVDGTEGVQGHTQLIWRLLRQRGVPTFFFVGKCDREEADLPAALAQLRARLSPRLLDLSGGFAGELPAAAVESLAEWDDELLERYLDGGYDPALWLRRAAQLAARGELFPVFAGSGLTGQGLEGLLAGLGALLPTDYEERREAPFAARVFGVRRDPGGGRVTFLKILSGSLEVKGEVGGEKVNEIRFYEGERYTQAPRALAGEVCGVTGLRRPLPGGGLGAVGDLPAPALQPVLQVSACWGEQPPGQVRDAFLALQEEDPALEVRWDETLRDLQLRVMGEIQLEVLQELMERRFGLGVAFGPAQICYRETIAAPAVGIGHFEPLRHYAEVWLRLEPGAPGSGVTFASECSTDALAHNWQSLIETHVLEKEHRGVLTGAPLCDVRVVLLKGRAHLKHTEGGDFRQAVYRAIRQGLCGAKSVLLEPWYDFTATLHADQLGRVLADIQRLQGSFSPPEIAGDTAVVSGSGPVATFLHYAAELPAFTHGRGHFSAVYGGYRPCHNADEVVAAAGYDPERDLENPPGSVFCARGAGYPVRWCDVPDMAHLK
ncbi:TetM/TetW/TetO/TetS family tetracycline resistance ribosomal protection protein [Acetanaerobacterium sp. MSJ-12]|uniref:elongation factor G n=1 Tax=Acetanaerobacterium sp. MSJ-12 TaxID=2841535 RepID=UPI001C0F2D6E|nr:TetM/TetW/TetO/TetS family tetracycline resistance ribosomal protection protein [Acetanaerobacterium sp. MSJ-12]